MKKFDRGVLNGLHTYAKYHLETDPLKFINAIARIMHAPEFSQEELEKSFGAICDDCGTNMKMSTGCNFETIRIDGTVYKRDRKNRFGEDVCHDCNAIFGNLHHFGCDVEQCPKCGGQLISCGCLSGKNYSIAKK